MQKSKDVEGLDLEALINQVDPPFTDEIMKVEVPPKFKVSSFQQYDGKKDFVSHLDT